MLSIALCAVYVSVFMLYCVCDVVLCEIDSPVITGSICVFSNVYIYRRPFVFVLVLLDCCSRISFCDILSFDL